VVGAGRKRDRRSLSRSGSRQAIATSRTPISRASVPARAPNPSRWSPAGHSAFSRRRRARRSRPRYSGDDREKSAARERSRRRAGRASHRILPGGRCRRRRAPLPPANSAAFCGSSVACRIGRRPAIAAAAVSVIAAADEDDGIAAAEASLDRLAQRAGRHQLRLPNPWRHRRRPARCASRSSEASAAAMPSSSSAAAMTATPRRQSPAACRSCTRRSSRRTPPNRRRQGARLRRHRPPGKFYATLARLGAEIVARRDFPDHHRYSEAEIGARRRREKR